jgi:hypothetical protein
MEMKRHVVFQALPEKCCAFSTVPATATADAEPKQKGQHHEDSRDSESVKDHSSPLRFQPSNMQSLSTAV